MTGVDERAKSKVVVLICEVSLSTGDGGAIRYIAHRESEKMNIGLLIDKNRSNRSA